MLDLRDVRNRPSARLADGTLKTFEELVKVAFRTALCREEVATHPLDQYSVTWGEALEWYKQGKIVIPSKQPQLPGLSVEGTEALKGLKLLGQLYVRYTLDAPEHRNGAPVFRWCAATFLNHTSSAWWLPSLSRHTKTKETFIQLLFTYMVVQPAVMSPEAKPTIPLATFREIQNWLLANEVTRLVVV